MGAWKGGGGGGVGGRETKTVVKSEKEEGEEEEEVFLLLEGIEYEWQQCSCVSLSLQLFATVLFHTVVYEVAFW